MKFREFSEFLQDIEKTNSRNEATVKLAEFFKKIDPDEVKSLMYLMQGRLVPKFIYLEFNFSDKLALKAIEGEFGVNSKELYSKLGDLGLVVETLQIKTPNSPSVTEIYQDLMNLAELGGKGSQESKSKKFIEIINKLDPISGKFVSRIIVGKLRLGFSEKTFLDAFSWFIKGDKSIRKNIEKAFGSRADLGEIAELIIKNKSNPEIIHQLETITIKVGVPVASKLVEREKDAKSVWERMPNCFAQPKLDGLRGQLHLSRAETHIFSRNMESLTEQFPEIINSLRALGVDSIILDSEIIGFDKKEQKFLSYQETMTRRRKYDIDSFSSSIPVKAMCFDVLFLNGKDLTHEKIETRLKLLEEICKKSDGVIEMLETVEMNNEEELHQYFTSKVEGGLEGIITKESNSIYEPGTRNYTWIKLKANTRSDLVDTIDVAVLGYYSGGGDRSRFGFGAILAGVYDPLDDKYYSIGKVGSGFKEENMAEMIKNMNDLKSELKPENYIVEKSLEPNVWVNKGIIMEIIADEITRSPSHTTARGKKSKVRKDDSSKGLSIRFPRIKIWNRQDKDYPNTVDEIIKMYELRKGSN